MDIGGLSERDVRDFGTAFANSSVASIDSFLARRSGFLDIGKLAIAATIGRLEQPGKILADGTPDHWYKLLWNAFIAEAHTAPEILQNAVRFVSFNYDRSLEYFLSEAVQHSFGIAEDQAIAVLEKVPVLHVYGKLGGFGLINSSTTRRFESELDQQLLRTAADGIKVIPEHRDDEIFKLVRKWFDWAERICFLGFGFDPLNVDRLGLESVLTWKSERGGDPPGIWASVFGLTTSEIEAHKLRSLGPSRGWGAVNANNTMTLRNTPLLLC